MRLFTQVSVLALMALPIVMSTTSAFAQQSPPAAGSVQQDKQQDKQQVEADRAKLQGDKEKLKEERKTVREDRKQLREDRRKLRKARHAKHHEKTETK